MSFSKREIVSHQVTTAEQAASAGAKIAVAWTGFVAGLSVQDVLQTLVLLVTLVYTGTQLWVLIRDKILRDKPLTPKE